MFYWKKSPSVILPILLISTAAAQQSPDCGELSEKQCIVLRSALERWNSYFAENVEAISFKYLGSTTDEDYWSTFSIESSSLAATIDPETGKLILKPLFEIYKDVESVTNRSAAENIEALSVFREGLPHVVEVTWSVDGRTETTRAFVGDGPPYVLDTMLNSVIILSRNQTVTVPNAIICDDDTRTTMSLFVVGQYLAIVHSATELSPYSSPQQSCSLAQSEWTYWGFGRYVLPDHDAPIRYSIDKCEVTATVGFAPLFSSVTIEHGGAGFQISGLGGGWTRDANCSLETGAE